MQDLPRSRAELEERALTRLCSDIEGLRVDMVMGGRVLAQHERLVLAEIIYGVRVHSLSSGDLRLYQALDPAREAVRGAALGGGAGWWREPLSFVSLGATDGPLGGECTLQATSFLSPGVLRFRLSAPRWPFRALHLVVELDEERVLADDDWDAVYLEGHHALVGRVPVGKEELRDHGLVRLIAGKGDLQVGIAEARRILAHTELIIVAETMSDSLRRDVWAADLRAVLDALQARVAAAVLSRPHWWEELAQLRCDQNSAGEIWTIRHDAGRMPGVGRLSLRSDDWPEHLPALVVELSDEVLKDPHGSWRPVYFA